MLLSAGAASAPAAARLRGGPGPLRLRLAQGCVGSLWPCSPGDVGEKGQVDTYWLWRGAAAAEAEETGERESRWGRK